MQELSISDLKNISGGDLILAIETLNFVGESILFGSFVGFLISPITTPNLIFVSGILCGICATASMITS